jgi:hypothetical protein
MRGFVILTGDNTTVAIKDVDWATFRSPCISAGITKPYYWHDHGY